MTQKNISITMDGLVEKIAEEINLDKKAEDDAGNGIPAETATELSDTENRILSCYNW